MTGVRLPWSPTATALVSPGAVVIKLPLGEDVVGATALADVRAGLASPMARFGQPSIDRVLGHFSDQVALCRVHRPARRQALPTAAFDDTEHLVGVSRTFVVQLDRACPINDLLDALHDVGSVEAASPVHYAVTHAVRNPHPVALDLDEAWESRDLINAAAALAYEPGDQAVIVALVDTGVQGDHEALAGRLRQGVDTVRLGHDVLPSIEIVGDEDDIDYNTDDDVGHGTACAGIIGAAHGPLPPGLAGICELLPMRALGAGKISGRTRPVGIGSLVDIDLAIKMAVDLDAKVLNLSLGTPRSVVQPGEALPHEEVVRYALARGCIVVAAAGNSGDDGDYAPACLDGVISVAGCTREGLPAPFSTHNDSVAIAAPGERVVSASLGGYARVTGTSFAAPFVASTAALLVSRAARRARPLDGFAVRDLLTESSVAWPEGTGAGYGAGRLDALAALRLLDRNIDREAV